MYRAYKQPYKEQTKTLTRSHNYRDNYFKQNSGLAIFGRAVYFCPYCGKAMSNKSKIAIDHIHSIRKVQYTKRLRERFKHKADGVNDLSNLVACCKRCNSRKGKKGGLWVVRGRYGMYFMPIVRLIMRLGFVVVVLYGLWLFLNGYP